MACLTSDCDLKSTVCNQFFKNKLSRLPAPSISDHGVQNGHHLSHAGQIYFPFFETVFGFQF
jgi:hypothetical protein